MDISFLNLLSFELFSGYMYSPYAFHLNRDASSLNRVINGDVESALGGFLASLLGVISKGLSGIVLISLIVIVDPVVAFGAILVLGCGYLLVYKINMKFNGSQLVVSLNNKKAML